MKSATLYKFLFVGLLLAFYFLSATCAKPPTTVKVIKVIDGDTIVLEGGYRVRYIGIDAPEKGEPYYSEAQDANRRLVQNKRVRLEKDISETDKYGRLLRYVHVDSTFVNAELVRQGYAKAHAYPPDIKYQAYLQAMEKEAQQEGKGIWKRKSPGSKFPFVFPVAYMAVKNLIYPEGFKKHSLLFYLVGGGDQRGPGAHGKRPSPLLPHPGQKP